MKKLLLAVFATATTLLSTAAQATSISVFEDFIVSDTGNIVYDQKHDLSYAVPIITNTETRSLAGAKNLAATLVVDGYGGWRVPTEVAEDPNCLNSNGTVGFGLSCQLGELNNLYNAMKAPGIYNNINIGYDESYHNGLYDVFTDGQGITDNQFTNSLLWLDNEFTTISGSTFTLAYMVPNGTRLLFIPSSAPGSLLAVQNGNVANLSAVPIPAAVWLFGSGLIGLIAVSRRKEKETTA